MAIATRTTTTLASDITQTTVVNRLLTAFVSAGYATTYDDYTTGTDRVLVYEFIYDNSKTFGKVYYKLRVTSSLNFLFQVCSAWNKTTKVATNASAEASFLTLGTTTTITFDALNGGLEYKFVIITQSTTSVVLGILCPDNKPTWWDVNAFPYGFAFNTNALNGLTGCALNPYSNTNYSGFFGNNGLSAVNLQTNRRDILTGIILLSNSGRGVAAKTSDDLALAAANGSAKFDRLSFPGSSQEYLIINNVAGGLALRVA